MDETAPQPAPHRGPLSTDPHDHPDCFSCRQALDVALPLREQVLRTAHWRVAHAFDSALPGWLVLLPHVHVRALDELPPAAWAELGMLQGGLTHALREVVGAAKSYTLMLAEAEGFSHLHVHVVPRMPDPPEERIGVGVFGWLGADETTRVPEDVRDLLAGRLLAALPDATAALAVTDDRADQTDDPVEGT